MPETAIIEQLARLQLGLDDSYRLVDVSHGQLDEIHFHKLEHVDDLHSCCQTVRLPEGVLRVTMTRINAHKSTPDDVVHGVVMWRWPEQYAALRPARTNMNPMMMESQHG